MPEGVEHSLTAGSIIRFRVVIIPLMPEGVEHTEKATEKKWVLQWVIIPLMPEGVEHLSDAEMSMKKMK